MMRNCRKAATLAAGALAALTVAACGTANTANSSSSPSASRTGARAPVPPGGYVKDDGDNDGDDPHIRPRGQDDQSLIAAYGGPALARAATAKTVAALVKGYLTLSLAGNATGACALLSAKTRGGLADTLGATPHGAASCAATVAPVLAQQHQHLLEEEPATMVVLDVYAKGEFGLALLGFRHSLEANILLQREAGSWKIDGLGDNATT